MNRIGQPADMQRLALDWRQAGHVVGFVPTMGFWHEGHLNLMRWARKHCDVLVASIFVNPTQFAPGEDLENYPSNLEHDVELARECGVDALFTPHKEDVYAPDHGTWVNVPELTHNLCGRSRPGHFQGVATVVCKLFHLVLPTFAVFGQKDWQQLAVIRKMTHDLNMPVRIEGRPIIREADGLAMSSRNVYLMADQRAVAPHLYQGLQRLEEMILAGERESARLIAATTDYYARHLPTGHLDYLELVDPKNIRTIDTIQADVLAAVALRLGKARLIDNKHIRLSS